MMVALVLAMPSATAAGQSPEPMLGHGIGLPERSLGAHGSGAPFADFRMPGSLRPFGMRLEYGGIRGGGNGIRISTMADSAFGLPGDDLARAPGKTARGTATARP